MQIRLFRLPYDTCTNTLQAKVKTEKLDSVDSRLFFLNKNYICRPIAHSNPLIVQLIGEYRRDFSARLVNNPTSIHLDDFFHGIDIFDDKD